MDTAFLEFLLNQGKLTNEKIATIKKYIQEHKTNTEQALVELGLLNKKELYKYKALFYNVGFIEDIFKIKIPQNLLDFLEKHIELIKKTKSLPFAYDAKNKTVKILARDFLNYNIKQTWRILLKTDNIEVYTTYPDDFDKFLIMTFGETLHEDTVEELVNSEATTNKPEKTSSLDTIFEQGSGITKFLKEILEYAVDLNASDIHIEPQENNIRIRLRIDGVLVEKFGRLPKTVLPELIAHIKILAKLRIDETRRPQDGRILVTIKGKKFDLRVATSPTIHGEKAVIRILPKNTHILSIEETGMRGKALSDFKKALNVTAGIILITGPTGSGKTTTLSTALHKLNTEGVNIITIEDPVEIVVPGTTQIQVNAQIGLTFANILRSVLRQDPDIIMVGEIRDKETAELAVQAALTGHLVLSTLHTNNAASTFIRLMDMGIEPYLLTSTIKAIVSQRLVRTICKYSRTAYVPPKDIRELIEDKLKILPNFDLYAYLEELAKKRPVKDPDDPTFKLEPPVKAPQVVNNKKIFYLYKGTPHPKCGDLAYKGRTGIFEVLWVSEAIKQAVLQRKSAGEIAQIAIQEGMIPLLQEGLIKAIEGITTYEEVLRVALL